MNADAEIKELVTLAFKHSPANAEYHLLKYIGMLRAQIISVNKNIVDSEKGIWKPTTLLDQYYKEAEELESRISSLEMHLSRLRSCG